MERGLDLQQLQPAAIMDLPQAVQPAEAAAPPDRHHGQSSELYAYPTCACQPDVKQAGLLLVSLIPPCSNRQGPPVIAAAGQ